MQLKAISKDGVNKELASGFNIKDKTNSVLIICVAQMPNKSHFMAVRTERFTENQLQIVQSNYNPVILHLNSIQFSIKTICLKTTQNKTNKIPSNGTQLIV